jgi:hypothetical protein
VAAGDAIADREVRAAAADGKAGQQVGGELIIEPARETAGVMREIGAADSGFAGELRTAVKAGKPCPPTRLVRRGRGKLLEGRVVRRLGLLGRGVLLTSTVSLVRQNAPWSIMIDVNMPAAPNAVSCVPLTPSPESASMAAASCVRLSPNKPGRVPPPLLNEVSSAAATADWLRVRPPTWPMPDARFSSTSVGV